MGQERWDRHWLVRALDNARMSKDPRTQVGAVLVRDRIGISDGWNGFPRGILDDPARLADRAVKLQLTVHAEMNAVLNAALTGVGTLGSTLYLVATDDTGEVWGGPPCTRHQCAHAVIQAGVREVVTLPRRTRPSDWHADMDLSEALLREAGVSYREVAARL